MNEYIVLEELRAQLAAGVADTAKDDILATYARTASRLIDREANRRFYPRVEARSYDIPKKSRRLLLDDDLLAVNTFTNGDDTEIPEGSYLLHPANEDVKYALEIEPATTYAWQTDPSGGQFGSQVIDVTGVWGWHDEWDLAWDAVSDVDDAVKMTASATTFTIPDYDGADSYGMPLAVTRQRLLKIEDEYLYVVSITEETSGKGTVTAIRGVNGSTAAEHLKDVPVSIYRPPALILQMSLRLALWLYKQRTAKSDIDRPAVTADGVTVLPMALPEDVKTMLSLVRRASV